MRFGGSLVLCALLWATAAAAQPAIVDPTPDPEDTTDWALGLEPTPVLDPVVLDNPSGLVFVGTRQDEEMLVLEKNTGRVRHFENRLPQADALNLAVDNCDERGLIGIVLHPEFDRSTPDTSDPLALQKDWVYLSYHSDSLAGSGAGSCDGSGTFFRVARFTWNGSALLDPVEVYQKQLTASETTLVGGGIGVSQEIVFEAGELDFAELLYIAIGSLGHDGSLQNNEDVPRVLDDTSVVLRLRAIDGSTPPGNPFDVAPAVVTVEDRYLGYGIRDAKAVLVDRFSGFVWLSERSDAGFDEVGPIQFGANGGFSDYKGPQDKKTLPKNLDDDDMRNPLYLLVDLLTTLKNGVTLPLTTYENPAFSFESPDLHPTGLAFGGIEVGPQHREDLFVGTEDGQLFRFNVSGNRQSFLLGAPLTDLVANIEKPPIPPSDTTIPADALTQILIANGFGAISDLETGVDGSLYVMDQTSGTLHRIFFNAERDLAVGSVKAPTKISLSAKKTMVKKQIKLTLENRGEVAERIVAETPDSESTPDVDEGAEDLRLRLTNLLNLEISSPSGCATPVSEVVVPKYARSPYDPILGIAPGGRLALQVNVTWACASPSPAGVADFETTLSLDMDAIGIVELDEHKADNVCPRPPDPDPDGDPVTDDPDPGCGAKTASGALGGDIVTDVTLK